MNLEVKTPESQNSKLRIQNPESQDPEPWNLKQRIRDPEHRIIEPRSQIPELWALEHWKLLTGLFPLTEMPSASYTIWNPSASTQILCPTGIFPGAPTFSRPLSFELSRHFLYPVMMSTPVLSCHSYYISICIHASSLHWVWPISMLLVNIWGMFVERVNSWII